jgi:hypothetical protein
MKRQVKIHRIGSKKYPATRGDINRVIRKIGTK